MAEYSRQLSQRVVAYASEINQLKALVARLQRMQFGKSFAKKPNGRYRKRRSESVRFRKKWLKRWVSI